MSTQQIKIGDIDLSEAVFGDFQHHYYPHVMTFGKIIPKDSTTAIYDKVSTTDWQINDGWEVEIISPTKLAIKKFKIDTWGLRQIIPADTHTGYNQFKVGVSGIYYVHENVVCHTADSTTPDGFTKAYGGTGGYNVYWYPGQFTSGHSMQGLVIQFGVGYTANNNEREDSLQIGKHPWDVGTRSCITDSVISSTWADGSYRAITIGLYGGVQNAASWHDETGDAYKVYDISDHPIYIDLNVDDYAKEDPTTIECWEAYMGEQQIYKKDKTLDNCWKKYGLAVPENWNITKNYFTKHPYIEWISPTKFIIKSIPVNGIEIQTSTINDTNNYKKLNWKGFKINVNAGLPNNASIKVMRTFSNAYSDYNEESHTWSNPIDNIETPLSVGENTIAPFVKELHKKETSAQMSYTECKIIIKSDTPLYDMMCVVEIETPYTTDETLIVTGDRWEIGNFIIPSITDLNEHIDKLAFNISPSNEDFWLPIKEYYKTNVFNGQAIYRKFRLAKKLDELSLILPNTSFLHYDNTFKHCSLQKLTLTGQQYTYITSLNGIFEGCGSLSELFINVNQQHDGDFLCGANDCSNMFNGCGLSTYPSNFICWSTFRTNSQTYSKPATIAHSMFWRSQIKTIPNYGNDINADENTILCGTASGIFNLCSELVEVGPIVDLQLINPQDAENIFYGCTKLTTIRIKNLNHGDWHFDNSEFKTGKKHGTLESLNLPSIFYLFNNLSDLNKYDSTQTITTINNSFSLWESSYFSSGIFESNYDFKFISMHQFVAKRRYETQESAPFIVHTSSTNISLTITVQGLSTTDSLVFGDKNKSDFIITKNGTYQITKNDTTDKGFKLIGDKSLDSAVTVTINRGWDLSISSVPTATIYCPSAWVDKVSSSMVSAANAKGWTINVGGTIVNGY